VLDYNGNGQWDGPPTDKAVSFGQAGDTPLVGDWNGSGYSKLAIFRAGLWVVDYTGVWGWAGAPPGKVMSLGQAGDKPLIGPW
jgi:hypothetical protein